MKVYKNFKVFDIFLLGSLIFSFIVLFHWENQVDAWWAVHVSSWFTPWWDSWHEPFWLRMVTCAVLLLLLGLMLYAQGKYIRENKKHMICPHCGKDIEIPEPPIAIIPIA